MAHDAVAEAAVIAIPDEQWGERPLGVVVLKEGEEATEEELLSHLASDHPKWSLPDAIEFVEEIPHSHRQGAQDGAARALQRLHVREGLSEGHRGRLRTNRHAVLKVALENLAATARALLGRRAGS